MANMINSIKNIFSCSGGFLTKDEKEVVESKWGFYVEEDGALARFFTTGFNLMGMHDLNMGNIKKYNLEWVVMISEKSSDEILVPVNLKETEPLKFILPIDKNHILVALQNNPAKRVKKIEYMSREEVCSVNELLINLAEDYYFGHDLNKCGLE